ncbi:MAG: hypothetical protein E7277_05330 [Lachnospiraceae bacterium]|nr:hypothetical protein [Lachnospiraceae bacterium]
MRSYRELLEEQLQEIREYEKKLRRNQEKWDRIADGNVKVINNHGATQYYLREKGQDKYQFVPKASWNVIKKLVQRDYERKVLKRLEKNREAITRFLKQYNIEGIHQVYSAMPKGRREMIKPIEKSVEEEIAEWREKHPGEQNPYAIERGYQTERGEIVRSKSEKIIADKLYHMGVPYQYEPMLILNGYHEKYPDFALYRVKDKRTVYWEHLGLADDERYAIHNLQKIAEYEKNGILLGRDLIVTVETAKDLLDVKLLEEKIRAFI